MVELRSIVNQLRTNKAELIAEIELTQKDKQDQLSKLNQCLSDIGSLVCVYICVYHLTSRPQMHGCGFITSYVCIETGDHCFGGCKK